MQSITIIGRRWFQRTYGNTYFSAYALIDGKPVGGLRIDRCTTLPAPKPGIDRAVNKNWDGHILVPVKVGRRWEWQDASRQS